MSYPPLSNAQLETLKTIRNNQSGFAALLGIRVTSITHGGACTQLDAQSPDLKNPTGTTVHGGALFTLADVTAGAAAWSTGFHCATAGADFHYIAPVLEAKSLTGCATALQMGRRACVFDVRIYDETRRLIAQGTFTYMTLKRRVLDDVLET